VTEAAGVVIFFWEEKWEVGVSAVHGLHDPPMICQYFNFFVLNFLSLSPSVANRSIGLLFQGIRWDQTCWQILCLMLCHIVVHFLNSEGCTRSNQAQHYSNCNHEHREEDPQPRCRL
jgi:hypothetical protein